MLSAVWRGNRVQARVGWVPKPVDARSERVYGCRDESPCVGDELMILRWFCDLTRRNAPLPVTQPLRREFRRISGKELYRELRDTPTERAS